VRATTGRNLSHASGVLAAAAALTAAAALASPPPGPAPPVPQIARDGWKDCSFNDRVLPCLDRQRPDGLEIVWKDGLRMRYVALPAVPGRPERLRDRRGGVWEREVLIQGNTVLTNVANGQRIVVPLRFPCRPPLRGEVGTCRP
jgi:hypothetical protein